jgi:predicted metal-dependent hydrolase
MKTVPLTLDPRRWTLDPMKSTKTAAMIDRLKGHGLDAHYLAYFECFNQQLFFEAHEALEQLWLPERQGPEGAYYKGLIQLAGAFVHLQKYRVKPAAALLRLAHDNLQKYAPFHLSLDVHRVSALIEDWRKKIESPEFRPESFCGAVAPRLELRASEEPGRDAIVG